LKMMMTRRSGALQDCTGLLAPCRGRGGPCFHTDLGRAHAQAALRMTRMRKTKTKSALSG
jgi:hypothetical protein